MFKLQRCEVKKLERNIFETVYGNEEEEVGADKKERFFLVEETEITAEVEVDLIQEEGEFEALKNVKREYLFCEVVNLNYWY